MVAEVVAVARTLAWAASWAYSPYRGQTHRVGVHPQVGNAGVQVGTGCKALEAVEVASLLGTSGAEDAGRLELS